MIDEKEQSAKREAKPTSNFDRSAMVSFAAATGIGIFSTISNIRNQFYEGFVLGWHRVKTPFTDLVNKANAAFDANVYDYENGQCDAKTYRENIRKIGVQHRTEINDKLLKEFDIPTDGVAGWVEGTVKRFEHLGNKTRLTAGLAFAATTAVGVGAVTLLRHNKATLDRVEEKIDQQIGR
jgi:hypothetical protein